MSRVKIIKKGKRTKQNVLNNLVVGDDIITHYHHLFITLIGLLEF